MSRTQRHRLAVRDEGHRRATVVSRSVTLGGTALAAVFGVVFAQHGTATANSRSVTGPVQAPPAAASTTQTPPAAATAPPAQQPQVLQPPVQPPAPAQGGGGVASSGGS